MSRCVADMLAHTMRRPGLSLPVAVAFGAIGGATCNAEGSWALCASALVALSAAVVVSSSRGRTTSVLVVGGGAAAWHASGTWWMGLAASDDGGQLPWRVAAVLIVAASQAAWVLVCWLPVRRWALRGGDPGSVMARAGAAWVVAWSAADVMRQIGWWGDGYASVATAMVSAPGAAALVPIIGAQGLGIVVLAAATLTAVAMLNAGRRIRHLKALAGGAAVTALFCVAFASFEWTDARGPPQHFVVLQTNVANGDGVRPADAAIDLLTRTVLDAAPGAVVVAPESFLAAPMPAQDSERWTRLRSLVEERDVHVLVGLPHFARDGQRTQLLNAVLHLAPRRWSLYAKERLVPGAEFQPLPHAMHVHRGDSPAPPELTGPLYVNHMLVGASISHELAFAMTMGERAADASMLLNVSDDGWVGGAAYRAHMLNLARLRAREFGKPLLRITNGGESSLVDPDGRILERARSVEPQRLEWSVVPCDGRTPYQSLMGWLAAAAIGAWLAVAMRAWPSKRRPS